MMVWIKVKSEEERRAEEGKVGLGGGGRKESGMSDSKAGMRLFDDRARAG
jgi:hypothetical protein